MEEFYLRGIRKPLRSYFHNLTANETTRLLNKASFKIKESSASNKLLENITSDILLSNLEQPVWGWEDTDNLGVLEHWKNCGFEVYFVLVFDHPKYILNDLEYEGYDIEKVNEKLEKWVEYHTSLLSFYKKNPSVCLLVEGTAALENFRSIKEKIESLSNTVRLKSSWKIDRVSESKIEFSQSDLQTDTFSSLLFKHYPQLIQVYNSLLDTASVKSSLPIYKSKSPSKENIISCMSALEKQSNNLNTKIKELEIAYNRIQQLEKLNKDMSSNLTSIELKTGESNLNHKLLINKLEMTNEKLILQLSEAYETIEELRKNIKVSVKVIDKEAEGLYGAERVIKQDLPYRIGSTIVNSVKTKKGLVTLPIQLLKECNEFKKYKTELGYQPKLSEYKDKDKAEKIEKQLSYRVGKKVIESSYSPIGILKTPFLVAKEVYIFKKNKK